MLQSKIRIENERLQIRGLKDADLDGLIAMRNDPKIYRFEPTFLLELKGTAEEALRAIRDMDLEKDRQLILGIFEKTDPDTLAGLAGTNRTYIYDALRECAGVTPTDFINGYRLRYAAHLLASTTDAVTIIAELSGFSRSSFFRVFSDAYGMSPSEYRRVVGK